MPIRRSTQKLAHNTHTVTSSVQVGDQRVVVALNGRQDGHPETGIAEDEPAMSRTLHSAADPVSCGSVTPEPEIFATRMPSLAYCASSLPSFVDPPSKRMPIPGSGR